MCPQYKPPLINKYFNELSYVGFNTAGGELSCVLHCTSFGKKRWWVRKLNQRSQPIHFYFRLKKDDHQDNNKNQGATAHVDVTTVFLYRLFNTFEFLF